MNSNNANNRINVVRSNVIIDSKRVRTNPLKGSMKAATLSRRAQIAKIPGKNPNQKRLCMTNI